MIAAVHLLILHELLCAVLLWSCFCRATRTNAQTSLPILVSFWFLAISALLATFAPLLFGWEPDAVSLVLLASIALVQTVTARYWQQSPPAAFQRLDPPPEPFQDSGRFSDRIPLDSECPTTQPTDWGKP